jgi:tetratricopeptide (TPR) repeat protein
LAVAAEHWAVAAEHNPGLLIPLVQIYIQQGRTSEAEELAERACKHYAERVASDPEDLDSRLLWARAECVRNEFGAGEQVLLDASRQAMEPSRQDDCQAALLSLYMGWWDSLRAAPEPDTDELLEIREKVGAFLHRVSGDSRVRPTVHYVYGTMAAHLEEFRTALQHLEEAYRAELDIGGLRNNLAWTLAHLKPPQLERALELANAALKAPTRSTAADLRDTRGTILFKIGQDREEMGRDREAMRRYREALSDLEAALQSAPRAREVHHTLAEVYEKLGDQELADEHRRLAGENDVETE